MQLHPNPVPFLRVSGLQAPCKQSHCTFVAFHRGRTLFLVHLLCSRGERTCLLVTVLAGDLGATAPGLIFTQVHAVMTCQRDVAFAYIFLMRNCFCAGLGHLQPICARLLLMIRVIYRLCLLNFEGLRRLCPVLRNSSFGFVEETSLTEGAIRPGSM